MGNRKGNWRKWSPEQTQALLTYAEEHGVSAAAREFDTTVGAVRGHIFRSQQHIVVVNIGLDDEMHGRLAAYRNYARAPTFSAALRDIIEWGLEVWEMEQPTKTSTTDGA